MKKSLKLLIIVIVSFFAILVVKDQIIKSVVTVVVTQVTDAPVHINGFSLGLLNQSVRISGFKMYNPKGFTKGILVDLPKINVAYDLGSIFKGKLHLPNVEIELKEMGLIKNKEGQLNVDSLKVVKQGKSQKAKSSERMPLQIDVLKLGMGKIIMKDYSAGSEPLVQVYDINVHKGYKNITSVQQLVLLIVAEPMKAAGIQGAKVYGVSMLAGVAVLPVAVALTFVGKDYAQEKVEANFDKTYDVSLKVLKRIGKVNSENRVNGVLSAEASGADIALNLKKVSGGLTEITISARKFLLPKPEIAAGIIYQISEELK